MEDFTFAKSMLLVEEAAQAQRAPTQTLVERFAKDYTLAVMALTALIILVSPLLFAVVGMETPAALTAVAACPCALLVATPVSIVYAISGAARNGVLIKGGAHLERVGLVKAIAFDCGHGPAR